MSFFEIQNYRDVIRLKIKENDSVRGYQSRLAETAGCHSSYLSQVLKGQVNLTPDQGIAFCAFWEYGELESDYFLILLNLERAGTERLRLKLTSDLERVREESRLIGNMLKKRFPEHRHLSYEDAMVYFSDWHYPAIKEALLVPELRTVNALSQRLGIPENLVELVLHRLKDMGLARVTDDHWESIPRDIGEFDDEVLVRSFHSSLRNRAMSRIALRDRIVDAHFGSVFTVEKKDLPVIKKLLVDVVNEIQEKKKDSQPQEVACLCFDFFLM